MSYCRCGDDSDVYVYFGYSFEVYLAQGNPSCFELMQKHNINNHYFFETEQETLDFLLKIKGFGFLIPDRAIERLQREISKLV